MAAITKEKYYQLTGLLLLASNHNAAIKVIEKAAAEITGEPDEGHGYYGITTDAIYEGRSASDLCEALEIEVVDA